MPIITDAQGTTSCEFDGWIRKQPIKVEFRMLQKACLIGITKILRQVRDTRGSMIYRKKKNKMQL